jgi:enoyl-CoA hydratase/carnithine racemase
MGRVIATVSDFIWTITFEGADERNLLTPELVQRLDAEITRFDQDPQARVAIVTGAGQRHFSEGADSPPGGVLFGDGMRAADREFGGVLAASLRRPNKPLVAAIRGNCFDAALVLLGRATDLRLATRAARFGFPQVLRGRGGDLAIGSGLLRQIPRTALMWLVATGQTIDAEEALRIGLVNELVDDGALLSRAAELAAEVATLAPTAVRTEKQSVLVNERAGHTNRLFYAEALSTVQHLARDAIEGVAAFNEKRDPKWTPKG